MIAAEDLWDIFTIPEEYMFVVAEKSGEVKAFMKKPVMIDGKWEPHTELEIDDPPALLVYRTPQFEINRVVKRP